MSNTKSSKTEYGYQPGKTEHKGYQPTKPNNGYQPNVSTTIPQTTPPSGGSSVQDK